MPGTLRVTEKEAIARGWIPAPIEEETEVEVVERVVYVERYNFFRLVIIMIVGWFIGFVMGLAF